MAELKQDPTTPRVSVELDAAKIDWRSWRSLHDRVVAEGERLYALVKPPFRVLPSEEEERAEKEAAARAADGFKKMVEFSTFLLANYPIQRWTPERREKHAAARALHREKKPLVGKFAMTVARYQARWDAHQRMLKLTPRNRYGDHQELPDKLAYGDTGGNFTRLKGESETHHIARELLSPLRILWASRINCQPSTLSGKGYEKVLDELRELGYTNVSYSEEMGFKVDYPALCGEKSK